MMKKIILFSVIIVFICCNRNVLTIQEKDEYKILKIDEMNDWYIIYANNKTSIYKIISKKVENKTLKCKEIIVGKSYPLLLHSIRENAPTIGGVKITPQNYLDVPCIKYDENTSICIEPENLIYDLYSVENLDGLCMK